MKTEIEKYFDGSIAVAGFSDKKNKFGNSVLKALIKKGAEVHPVHHRMDKFEDLPCVKKISEISPVPHSLYISMQPDKAQFLINEAIELGVKNIWFQQGSDFHRLAEIARDKGINVIENKCIMMYAEPVKGIHAFHRFLSNIFSRD